MSLLLYRILTLEASEYGLQYLQRHISVYNSKQIRPAKLNISKMTTHKIFDI